MHHETVTGAEHIISFKYLNRVLGLFPIEIVGKNIQLLQTWFEDMFRRETYIFKNRL
jgi:hypothetical protein